ncbi:MAG: 50S ribosomal protein L3 N(5)-glutamine methyltransferase [Gammaproteobacteria bacterium]|nr:MAG: 50S ribosomal protein L3 N(5)-glutamine methyltransferase [Gammaproteobacteria bacterium]
MSASDDVSGNLKTIGDIIRWGVNQFEVADLSYGHGTDNAHDEAAWLLAHALHYALPLEDSDLGLRLTAQDKNKVLGLFDARIKTRKPAAYLTHEAWFAGYSFYVDERVLVPRSPIAEMIKDGFQPWAGLLVIERILDIGTGSGCIAIACAHRFPGALVDAADISPAALEVTRINIEMHNLENRVSAIESDLFSALGDNSYDLIVSNPPYVSRKEMESLPGEYRHEPVTGLAAGEDGLDAVNRIFHEASRYLKNDGILVLEVGDRQDEIMDQYSRIEMMWPEFVSGGGGILVASRAELSKLRKL